jgi:hypothetical protein
LIRRSASKSPPATTSTIVPKTVSSSTKTSLNGARDNGFLTDR